MSPEPRRLPATFLDEVTDIAALVMKLGEVERATRHPDGRPETDTTHTVMLALIAWRFAIVSRMQLDIGMLLALALVHDLVEAYAGDVNTARGLTEEQRADKEAAETEALARIAEELPWIGTAIEVYEAQELPEARVVRYLDKVMPKLTHRLNGFDAVRAIGMGAEEMRLKHALQGERLAERYPELHAARELFEQACHAAEQEFSEETADWWEGLI